MTIIATIIVLGVLIFVHELGHFGAAKAVGVEVERFSIGLGPKVAGFTRGETEYVISAIPLGGYVKMGGMDDEVMERLEGGDDGEARTPGPRDFDSKPLWARAFVISAGVIMNMLFAYVVYAGSVALWGFQARDTTRVGTVYTSLLPEGTEELSGLETGARIVRIGDREIEDWGDVTSAFGRLPVGPVEVVTAEPAATFRVRVPGTDEERGRLQGALRAWAPGELGQVNPGSVAEKAGLETGDRVVAVEGTPVEGWFEFVDLIQARAGERTEIVLERGGTEIVRTVTPRAEEEPDPGTGVTREVGKIGVWPPIGELVNERASLGEALVYGWRETVATTGMILGFLGDLVTGGISPRSVGSIVTIGEASGQAAALGIQTFLRFMALFSINLAVLNLLPIPVLDGGHLLFLTIEGVRGRALSVEQRLKWSNVGFLIVMGIMLWALSNDFLRLFGL